MTKWRASMPNYRIKNRHYRYRQIFKLKTNKAISSSTCYLLVWLV